MGRVEEPLERRHRAVVGVDDAVVGDVVPVVAQRRRVERQQPQRGDAEVGQVVEPRREPLEVAGAVAVRVGEGSDVQLVDDGVAVPVVGHRAPLRRRRRSATGRTAKMCAVADHGAERRRSCGSRAIGTCRRRAGRRRRTRCRTGGRAGRGRRRRSRPARSWGSRLTTDEDGGRRRRAGSVFEKQSSVRRRCRWNQSRAQVLQRGLGAADRGSAARAAARGCPRGRGPTARSWYFSESRYSSEPGAHRHVLLQLERRPVDAPARRQRRGEDGTADERGAAAVLQLLGEDVGRVRPRVRAGSSRPCGVDRSVKYSRSSHAVCRHAKYVYDWLKPTLASRSMTRGRVNASARKIVSGCSLRSVPQRPLPERQRLGVRVVDAEDA